MLKIWSFQKKVVPLHGFLRNDQRIGLLMKQKRIYRIPEVTIGCFLVKEYMMWGAMSQAPDPAPPRRDPKF